MNLQYKSTKYCLYEFSTNRGIRGSFDQALFKTCRSRFSSLLFVDARCELISRAIIGLVSSNFLFIKCAYCGEQNGRFFLIIDWWECLSGLVYRLIVLCKSNSDVILSKLFLNKWGFKLAFKTNTARSIALFADVNRYRSSAFLPTSSTAVYKCNGFLRSGVGNSSGLFLALQAISSNMVKPLGRMYCLYFLGFTVAKYSQETSLISFLNEFSMQSLSDSRFFVSSSI